MRSRQGKRGIRGPRGREREGEEREMEAEGKALYMSPTFYGQKRFFGEKIFGDSGNSNECLLFVPLAREKRVSGNGSGWLKIERVWNWGRDEGGG